MTVKGIFSTHAFTFVKQQLRNKFQKMFQHSEPSLSTGISRTAFTQTTVLKTILHSSRMRTTRSLTVSPSMLCSRGGCLVRGGAWSWGVPGPRGCLVLGGPGPGGGGGIPACTEADPPVNRITDACKNITLSQLCCGR